MKKLFNPETMKAEYHTSLKRKLKRNLITAHATKCVMDARTERPQIYMSLASLAHEESDSAFRSGIRIFMDAFHPED